MLVGRVRLAGKVDGHGEEKEEEHPAEEEHQQQDDPNLLEEILHG
jgi:hypothetical protein